MRSLILKSILTVLLSVGAAGSATAVVIDFESTALGDYSSLTFDDVTVSGILRVSDNLEYGAYVGAAPGSHFVINASSSSTPITFAFAPTNYFGLQIGGVSTIFSAQSLTAYDAAGTLLGTVTVPNLVDSSYALNFAAMAKVELSQFPRFTGPNNYVVDNVTVGAVPEPGTGALVVLGVVAVALLGRGGRVRRATA